MSYPTPTTIRNVVARAWRIKTIDMLRQARHQRFSRPRHVAMALARELTPLSFPELGRDFCRDHSIIVHAIERVAELSADDPTFKAMVDECRDAVLKESAQ